MIGPKPLPSILDIVPYKGGEPSKTGWKLSSNENPLGASDKAKSAIAAASQSLERYPDGSATALRRAIGAKYGLDPERLIIGAGSDEIFQLLGRAYLRQGDEIIQSAHGFLVYRLIAQQSGAITKSAPETNYTANVDAILSEVTDKTRIVFLANPNNPTGTYLPYSEIERLHARLRSDIMLVLDGAYAEYVTTPDYQDGAKLAETASNVLMTRTFSKIHGLAALRLGWAYGPAPIIDVLNRVRGPFNVNALALAAGLAALEDDAFMAQSIAHNTKELARMQAGLDALGFTYVPSVGNFLLVIFTDEAEKRAMDRHLRSRDIVVRDMTAYGLPACLRISLGTEAANSDVLAAFKCFARA